MRIPSSEVLLALFRDSLNFVSVELYMPMEAFFTSEVRPLDQPDHKAIWVWYCSDSGAIAIFTLVVLGLVMGEIVLFWSTQI